MFERGTMCQGTHLAQRFYQSFDNELEVSMPVRDRKFGVLEQPYKQQGRWRIDDVEWYTSPPQPRRANKLDTPWCMWGKVPYEWAHGIYLGRVRKQNGQKDYIGYDEGYAFAQTGKSFHVAMIALHGKDDGVVLMYAPLDKMEAMA